MLNLSTGLVQLFSLSCFLARPKYLHVFWIKSKTHSSCCYTYLHNFVYHVDEFSFAQLWSYYRRGRVRKTHAYFAWCFWEHSNATKAAVCYFLPWEEAISSLHIWWAPPSITDKVRMKARDGGWRWWGLSCKDSGAFVPQQSTGLWVNYKRSAASSAEVIGNDKKKNIYKSHNLWEKKIKIITARYIFDFFLIYFLLKERLNKGLDLMQNLSCRCRLTVRWTKIWIIPLDRNAT